MTGLKTWTMISFKGTDFQMLLLEAAIYKKTGERWRKSKKMWITKLEKKNSEILYRQDLKLDLADFFII